MWFDEATRDKIQILGKDLSPLYNLIDKENLPKEYGGDLDWKFEDEPSLDEDARRVLEQSLSEKQECEVSTSAMPRGPKVFVGGKVWSAREYLEKGLALEAVVQHAGGEAGKGVCAIVNEEKQEVNGVAGGLQTETAVENGAPLINATA